MRGFFKKRAIKKVQQAVEFFPFMGLRNAKNALILFSNSTPNKSSMVLLLQKMFDKNGIEVDFKGFVYKKLEKNKEPVKHYYYTNQLNWLNFPKKEIVQELTQKKYDVVIDLDLENKQPNSFILLNAKAALRVGFIKNKPFCDVIVEKKDYNENDLVQQLEHYLTSIEKQ